MVHIREDKSPMQRPMIGFIAFDDKETREFCINALTRDGQLGRVRK